LTPLLALSFVAVPWHGLLVNLVAIPLFSFFLMPVMLAAVLLWALLPTLPFVEPLLTFLWVYCDHLLSLFVDSLMWLDQMIKPLSSYVESPVQALLACCGALLLLVAHRLVTRFFGVLLLLPLFIAKPASLAPGALEVGVVDVGQGLAVWLRTANHSLLYDTGAGWQQGSQAQMVVVPVLQRLGINRLDRLIISHSDNDHAGGVEDVLAAMPVASLQVGEPLAALAAAGELCHQAKPWQWDEVWFEYLVVPEPLRRSSNNHSCVLMVTVGANRILLAGDIDRQAEQALVALYGERLDADVLLSPHHGSHSSSSWLFLRQVAPAHVIHSTAYGNRFGHPANVVAQRFDALGVVAWNTAERGAVTISLTPSQAPRLSALRDQPRYFWQQHNN
jgi:competence protein ComEC